MSAPRVSVLLSVHRDRGGLRETVAQVLAQSMGDLELIAVDDGSTDATAAILDELARGDRRLRVLTNPRNLGLTPSLNRGLELAGAPWIARIDEGDGWDPRKLDAQLARVAREPELVLVGTQARYVDAASAEPLPGPALPVRDEDLRAALSSAQNPFIHSSVLFRRLRGVRYNEAPALGRALDTISDYELWLRLSLVGRLANLDEALVTFAFAGGHAGLTTEAAPLQFDLKRRLRRAFLRALRDDRARAVQEGLDAGSALPRAASSRRQLSFGLRYRAVSAPVWRRHLLRAAGYALDPRDLAFHVWSKALQPYRPWDWDPALRRELEQD